MSTIIIITGGHGARDAVQKLEDATGRMNDAQRTAAENLLLQFAQNVTLWLASQGLNG